MVADALAGTEGVPARTSTSQCLWMQQGCRGLFDHRSAARQARSDLNIKVCGVDISAEVLEFAKEGTYSLSGSDHQTARDQRGMSIFERVTPITRFDRQGDQLKVKPWLEEGVRWHCGSVDDPSLPIGPGPQDIVVANCFLCHMQPASAERSLRNVARLVKPGGYLFASGVDLDVRVKVSKELGWELITECPNLMKEVYEGDRTLSDGRPIEYWAIEPFRATQRDWTIRYSSAFRLGLQACGALGRRHVRSARGRRGSGRDELVVVKVDVAGTASAGTGMRG